MTMWIDDTSCEVCGITDRDGGNKRYMLTPGQWTLLCKAHYFLLTRNPFFLRYVEDRLRAGAFIVIG